MNPYDYEYEVQRHRDRANGLGRQAYELLQQDAAVAERRREQRAGFGQALSGFIQRLRRPRQRRRAPAEATPARGSPRGA